MVERHGVSCHEQKPPSIEETPTTGQHSLKMDRVQVSIKAGCSMLPALALVRAALRTKSAIYRLFTVRAEPAAEHTVVGCCCRSVCPCQVFYIFIRL